MTVKRPHKSISYAKFPGKPLVAVAVDGTRIGTYEIVEGGFLPQGRSVPSKREIDARFLVIMDEAALRVREAHRMIESARHYFLNYEIEMNAEAVDGVSEYESWSQP